MNKRLSFKISDRKKSFNFNFGNLPLYILLITCSSKWFAEGMLSMPLLEVALILLGFGLVILQRGAFAIKKSACIWFVYAFSIIINITINRSSFSLWGRASMMVLITAYAIFLDSDDFDVKKIIRFLTKIGIFHAFLVILHFILKDTFNDLVFPLLNAESRDFAGVYYRSGYYFGILYSPHEVAGLISFAIAALLFWVMVNEPKNYKKYLPAVLLFVPLLLTGKKGVLLCIVAAIFFTVLVLFASNKQWERIIAIFVLLFIGFFALRAYILAHPDNALFYRFGQLFIQDQPGAESLDSNRTVLYGHAFDLWKDNPIFGIGWKHFKGLTTTMFNFPRPHEVNCDYIQWLCEMGLFGIILNLTPVFITLYRTLYICRRGIRRIEDKVIKWSVLFAVTVQFYTLMYAVVEIPFYDIMFFSVYIISCIIINTMYIKLKSGKIVLSNLKAYFNQAKN